MCLLITLPAHISVISRLYLGYIWVISGGGQASLKEAQERKGSKAKDSELTQVSTYMKQIAATERSQVVALVTVATRDDDM